MCHRSRQGCSVDYEKSVKNCWRNFRCRWHFFIVIWTNVFTSWRLEFLWLYCRISSIVYINNYMSHCILLYHLRNTLNNQPSSLRASEFSWFSLCWKCWNFGKWCRRRNTLVHVQAIFLMPERLKRASRRTLQLPNYPKFLTDPQMWSRFRAVKSQGHLLWCCQMHTLL